MNPSKSNYFLCRLHPVSSRACMFIVEPYTCCSSLYLLIVVAYTCAAISVIYLLLAGVSFCTNPLSR